MNRYPWLLSLALLAAAPVAHAQEYLGIGIGSSEADIRGDAEEAFLAVGGECGVNVTCTFDESDTGIKIFGGSRFSPNFALEGFYVDFGSVSASATGPSTSGGTLTLTLSADASAFGLAAVGLFPIGGTFDFIAKAGLARWSADTTASAVDTAAGSGSASESDDGVDPMFGIGLQWNGGAVSIRGEFERFDVSDTDVDLLSVSAIFSF